MFTKIVLIFRTLKYAEGFSTNFKTQFENKIEVTIFICPACLPNVQMDSTLMTVIIKMIDTHKKKPFLEMKKEVSSLECGLKNCFCFAVLGH